MILNFKPSDYIKLLFKEFSIQIIEKIIRIVCGFFLLRALSNYLGTEDYGSLIYIESMYLLFFGLSDFGLAPNVIKLFGKSDSSFNLKIFNSLLLSGLASVVGFVFFNLFNFFVVDFEHVNLLFLMSIALILNPIIFIEYYYYSQNKIRKSSIIRIVSYLICFLFKLYAIHIKLELEVFVIIMFIEVFLTYLFLLISIRKSIITYSLSSNFFSLNKEFFKVIFKNSFYVFLYGLGVNLFYKIDIIMIQRYLTENDLGNYSASFKLISFLTFLPIITANTFNPRILKTINYDDQILKKMYFLSFWISAIVFSFIFLSGSYIINYLYGDNFPMALDVFKISSITLVIIGLNGTYNKVIIKNELNHLLLIKSFFGIFLCITLNIILIPNYGIIGVSYATVLSLFLSDIILDFFIKDLRKHHILKLKSILYFKTIKL